MEEENKQKTQKTENNIKKTKKNAKKLSFGLSFLVILY